RLVGVNDDLGVALRTERVPERDELRAELHVVEDLAVEGDPHRLVFVGERLLARRKIDDGEARVREAGAVVAVDAELVRAAVAHGAAHRAELLDGGAARVLSEGDDAGDAAHGALRPPRPSRPGWAACEGTWWPGAWPRCPCTRARPARR